MLKHIMSDLIELELKGDLAEVSRLKGEVEAFAEQLGLAADIQFELIMALEEAVANIINHGQLPPEEGMIRLKIEHQNGVASIELCDNGQAFNPLQGKEPDLKIPFEDREIGGLGIFYLKQMMDSLDYRFVGGQNILHMKKNLT